MFIFTLVMSAFDSPSIKTLCCLSWL